MHKYVEAIKLLLEFELLSDIEFFLKKWNKYIFIVNLLREFKFNS